MLCIQPFGHIKLINGNIVTSKKSKYACVCNNIIKYSLTNFNKCISLIHVKYEIFQVQLMHFMNSCNECIYLNAIFGAINACLKKC